MENYVSIAILVVVAIITAVNFYYTQLKGKSKAEILTKIKEEAMKLFLYAEKQGWTGPDKMAWCVQQLVKLFPAEIAKFIEGPLEEYIQKLYDEFKKTIYIDQATQLGIQVEVTVVKAK